MSKTVSKVRQQIVEAVAGAVESAITKGLLPDGKLPEYSVEVPADRSHGDYAVNAAMVSARVFKLSPRVIAEAITANMSFEGTYIKSAETAGPGFINFELCDCYYADIVSEVLAARGEYGRSDYGKGEKVLIEFVSANPTGPMHIGNARGGALGDCLASVMDAAGFDVKREYYVNDAGNQIEKLKTSLEIRYLQLFKPELEMPEDAYHGDDIIQHAKAFAEINGDSFVVCPSDKRRQALCDFALPKNIEKLKSDLEKYRINYDRWFLESELHNSGAVDRIIDKLKDSGYTYEKDGALWFRSSELGDEKDRVLVRENGIPTYSVPDIAYHYNKLITRGFDRAVDILGADHHGYVPRMKAAMRALGIDENRLEIDIYQMVRLVKNGETYKLSKRSGKAITLETLLDEVPIDAARFFFNLREPNSHLEFDLDLAVSQSAQNPVYYVQYAHARICSIIKNLKADGVEADTDSAELTLLCGNEERELIRLISAYTGEIVAAARERNPSIVTRYAVELATQFHKFYNASPVKTAQPSLKNARLVLCIAAKTVICNVLELLKIAAPESM